MALTYSTMVALGSPIPAFHLPDVVSGRMVSPEDFSGQVGLLVMFICKHCPYVIHMKEELAQIGKEYQRQRIGMVAISSNDIARYADDSPNQLQKMAEQIGFTFPICYDESQQIAKNFTAACTPDFFLYGPERILVYRGQFDDSRPGSDHPVTGRDLRMAIHAVLAGETVNANQKPSVGCSIKWKVGKRT